MKRTWIMLFCIMLAQFSSVVQAENARESLAHALRALDSAITSLENNDIDHSQGLSLEVALLENTIEQYDLHSPRLYHTLGNAYFLNGDLGRAILAYRRGEDLAPTDFRLNDSLAHARDLVQVRISPSTEHRIWGVMLSWKQYIPKTFLMVVFLLTSTAGWLICSMIPLGFHHKKILIPGLALISCSLVAASMLSVDWIDNRGLPQAVIVDTDVEARTGPGDQIYDLAFENELQPGVEGRVIETRNKWHRLQLADGSECWILSESLEQVNRLR